MSSKKGLIGNLLTSCDTMSVFFFFKFIPLVWMLKNLKKTLRSASTSLIPPEAFTTSADSIFFKLSFFSKAATLVELWFENDWDEFLLPDLLPKNERALYDTRESN